MQKRQSILFVFFISFFVLQLHAQDSYITVQLTDMVGQMNWDRKTLQGESGIEGSPYLAEEFKKGEVYYGGKYKVPNVPLRLNLYNDQFEYKEKNTVMAFADPKVIDKIVLEDEVYIYIEKNVGSDVDGFVKMWNAELPGVLTKMKTLFKDKEEPKPFEEPKPDRFERTLDKHYIMMSKEEIKKISSVKKLIKYLGNHTDELSSFAKKEKISSGDPEELAKLLDYYNELE